MAEQAAAPDAFQRPLRFRFQARLSASVQEEAAEVALTALDEQGRREMEAIQAALAHIDAGTYGICETCGETISAARLTARPTARRCVSCQERLEHRRTQV